MNSVIASDAEYKQIVPVEDEAKLMEEMQDGVLLAKVINHAIPNTVDSKALIRGNPLTVYQKTENLRLAINGAIQIGCANSSLTPHMIIQGKSALVISLICQLKKVKELQVLNKTPDLVVLAKKGETLEELYRASTEDLLIRWLNYHLANAPGSQLTVKDLGKDLQDGVVYLTVLNQIAPQKCGLEGIGVKDVTKRMEIVLNNIVNIGVSHSFKIEKLLEESNKLHKVLCCMIFNLVHGLKSTITPLLTSNEFLRSLGA